MFNHILLFIMHVSCRGGQKHVMCRDGWKHVIMHVSCRDGWKHVWRGHRSGVAQGAGRARVAISERPRDADYANPGVWRGGGREVVRTPKGDIFN